MKEEISKNTIIWNIIKNRLPKKIELISVYSIGLLKYEAITIKKIHNETLTLTVSVL